jgi:hypothetical protein
MARVLYAVFFLPMLIVGGCNRRADQRDLPQVRSDIIVLERRIGRLEQDVQQLKAIWGELDGAPASIFSHEVEEGMRIDELERRYQRRRMR